LHVHNKRNNQICLKVKSTKSSHCHEIYCLIRKSTADKVNSTPPTYYEIRFSLDSPKHDSLKPDSPKR